MLSPQSCGLNPQIIAGIRGVFGAFPEIDRVVLYGSRAVGNFRNGSDIDLTIVLKPGQSPDSRLLAMIAGRLDELDLIYSFDLSFFTQLQNPALVDHIERMGVQFYP